MNPLTITGVVITLTPIVLIIVTVIARGKKILE
jgi:hypothetical protein